MKPIPQCWSIILLAFTGCHSPMPERNSLAGNPLRFQHSIIDSAGVENPWVKICADLDGDRKTDVIIGGQKGPLIWYRNPDWQRFVIAPGDYQTVDGEAGDIDGDGDPDIVVGGLFWYENPGKLHHQSGQPWTAHSIADHATHDVELADINSDGRLDVITRNQSDFGTFKGNKIHLWMNQPEGIWLEKILDCNHGEGLRVTDLDSDGDPDIIGGGFWFENADVWQAHVFSDWHPSANLEVADLNHDGRQDIILTPSELAGQFHRISWFEQPATNTTEKWIEHVLIDSIECVIHGVAVSDFNADGSVDIAYSEMHQGADPDEVVVLINQKNAASWHKMVISSQGSHSIQAADINGDHIPDIMGANWSGPYQVVECWISTAD